MEMTKSKFLFFGPSVGGNSDKYNFSAPPLGVHRVASYLRNHGHHADVVDPDLERLTEESFKKIVRDKKYDFVGISPTHITLENDLGLAYLTKKYSPSSTIIAGGQEATFAYDLVMDNSPVDVVVVGEGEKPALGIANARKEGGLVERLGGISGLIIGDKKIKTGNNTALNNEEFTKITMGMDFTKIPYYKYWEAMEKLYEEDLKSSDLQLREKRQHEIYTMRLFQANFCPYKCTFCGSRGFQNEASGNDKTKVVSLSGENFVELVKKGYKAHPKIKNVIIQDDNFMVGIGNNKIEKIVETINREKKQGHLPKSLSFIAQSRVDNVNLERLRMLKDANFRMISYGIESFSQKMLNELEKGTTVERAEQTLRDTLAVDIKPYLNTILTAPDSDIYDMFKTIDRSVHYLGEGAEVGSYNTIIPLPGSRIEKTTRGSDLVKYTEAKIAFTNKTIKKAERLLPKDKKLRQVIDKYDEVIDEKKAEFMKKNNLELPKSPESASSKATRVNTLVRFATLYGIAKEMDLQPYGGRADKMIPKIEGMLSKF